jgi:hypothetical protein
MRRVLQVGYQAVRAAWRHKTQASVGESVQVSTCLRDICAALVADLPGMAADFDRWIALHATEDGGQTVHELFEARIVRHLAHATSREMALVRACAYDAVLFGLLVGQVSAQLDADEAPANGADRRQRVRHLVGLSGGKS